MTFWRLIGMLSVSDSPVIEPPIGIFDRPHTGPNALQRLGQRFASSRVGVAMLRLTLRPTDMLLFRLFGGRINLPGVVIGCPETVLITTRGARSGTPHTVPMLTHPGDDGALVIIGTNYGKSFNPAWYYNLLADPRIDVTYLRRTYRFRAREASAEERQRYWQAAQQRYIGYDAYQRFAGDRRIPIMVLEPDAGERQDGEA